MFGGSAGPLSGVHSKSCAGEVKHGRSRPLESCASLAVRQRLLPIPIFSLSYFIRMSPQSLVVMVAKSGLGESEVNYTGRHHSPRRRLERDERPRREAWKFLKLIPLSEAMARTETALEGSPWPSERVRVDKALMRISAAEAKSSRNLPSSHIAAMDGYAVKSADLKGSRFNSPVLLKVRGILGPSDILPAGKSRVAPGEAFEVATGAPLPSGADLVVKAEDAKGGDGSFVKIFREFPRWKNVFRLGEDVRKSSPILRKSQPVTPAALALCLACGKKDVMVSRRPLVGVLSVGTELVEFPRQRGTGARKGRYNNYSNMVRGYVEARGLVAVSLGICPDNRELIQSTIQEKIDGVDCILTIAGSSVGRADLVAEVLGSIPRTELLFHGVRAAPIRPTGLAVVRRKGATKLVVMLPGHAVSAALATFTVALPAINMLSGQPADFGRISVNAEAEEKFENRRALDTLFLARVTRKNGEYRATPLPWGSNLLRSLSEANGFVHLGARQRIGVSSRVDVELLGAGELLRVPG